MLSPLNSTAAAQADGSETARHLAAAQTPVAKTPVAKTPATAEPSLLAELPGVTWQQAMKQAVRNPATLCRLVNLPHLEAQAVQAAQAFGLFAPLNYVARMRSGDANDPLLRQVLPLDAETQQLPGFVPDPVADLKSSLSPGVLHKYKSRVLMVTTGACAVHCRYCFRRHYPYNESPKFPKAWDPALERIAADPEIREVILSGGDPLTLTDPWLAELVTRLNQIPTLRRLRIHTRLPVIIPQRIGDDLLSWLTGGRLTPVMVIHANHANELQDAAAAAIGRLVDAGVPVLNQAVLLRGVNDSLPALRDLCERLIDLRAIPYYLHQLDRVQGAAHFEVPIARGLQLMEQLRAELPGYAVPRYVQEIAGRDGKTVLA